MFTPNERELTFGEKAVGLTFNPGGHPFVNDVKSVYAKMIDILNDERESLKKDMDAKQEVNEARSEKLRMYSLAITELQTSQMWAVKAITWNS